MKNVLIIEDSKDIGDWLKISLELKGYNCKAVNKDFEQLLDPNYYDNIDTIILDIWLRSSYPYEVDRHALKSNQEHLLSIKIIKIVRNLARHIRIIVFSALTDVAGLSEYVDAVVLKPASIKEIIKHMEDR